MMQELSMNILDVAENSVRAGASLVEITVDEQPDKDRLTITISDNGCGMSAKQLEQISDPFFTTRTTRKVGLGIPFFRMAAELTGGSLDISSTEKVGTVITAVFVLSSIDLMPMGDLNESIFVLIHGSPDIDFLFTRRFGEAEMVLDTRSFRKILGDIPLNAPQVSGFIRDFLAENTQELLQTPQK